MFLFKISIFYKNFINFNHKRKNIVIKKALCKTAPPTSIEQIEEEKDILVWKNIHSKKKKKVIIYLILKFNSKFENLIKKFLFLFFFFFFFNLKI